MIASTLVAAVRQFDTVSDFSDSQILALLNRGVMEIAGGGDRQHGNALLAPLPDLFLKTTLAVTAQSTAMPATYHRSLARVTNASGDKLKRYDSLIKFLDDYEGLTGTPEAYCLKGRTLWVGPISSSTLNLYYTRLPVDMAITAQITGPPLVPAVDSAPDGIPAHLQYRLLVNFACKEIARILGTSIDNDGEELKHNVEYQKALTDLERLIGFEDGEAQNVSDEYSTDDNI